MSLGRGAHLDAKKVETRVFPDLATLSQAALEEVERVVEQAVHERGRCAVSLAGGRTPKELYTLWANRSASRTDWERVHLFWGDERCVPPGDPRSNFRMAQEALISRIPIPLANVHPMPTDFPDAARAAAEYETTLRRFFRDELPAFDLQLLGMGVEGHTASLFPGSPALEEKQRWVLAVRTPLEPPQRLTLTPVVLNQGRNTFFLVTGTDKRHVIEALRHELGAAVSRFPVGRIHPAGRVTWFLDQAAAP